jgi:hypothetical protein
MWFVIIVLTCVVIFLCQRTAWLKKKIKNLETALELLNKNFGGTSLEKENRAEAAPLPYEPWNRLDFSMSSAVEPDIEETDTEELDVLDPATSYADAQDALPVAFSAFYDRDETPPDMPEDRLDAPIPETPAIIRRIAAFVKNGHAWVAGGVLLLFTAFVLLLSYMARRGFFTLEMRIALSIVGGLAMLVVGWFVRKKKAVYALVLQGGGIAVLYLSFYAAYRLLSNVPPTVALALISTLVLLTIALSLLQNAQALAILALAGGFAAPLLVHNIQVSPQISLLSYYMALNVITTVVVILRRWMPLALLSFAGTFISVFWVVFSLDKTIAPATFAGVAGLTLGFIAIYTFLGLRGVLQNKQEAASAEKPLSFCLTFSVPVAAAISVWQLFSLASPHGPTIASAGLAIVYIALAIFLHQKFTSLAKPATLGYLTLAILFANIAVPLELSANITSAVWALESVALFVCARFWQTKNGMPPSIIAHKALRISGGVFHGAAIVAFIIKAQQGTQSATPLFHSAAFSGSLIIALAALAIVVLEKRLNGILVVWAFAWWWGAWCVEASRGMDALNFTFIFSSISALIFFFASRITRKRIFEIGLIPIFLCAVFIVIQKIIFNLPRILELPPQVLTINFLYGQSLLAWLIFFAVSVGLLIIYQKNKLHEAALFIVLMLGVTVITCTGRFITQSNNFSYSWTSLAGIVPSFVCVFLLALFSRRLCKAGYTSLVNELPISLCVALVIWFSGSIFSRGNPAPLPVYIPFVNPLDLQQAFCIIIILLRHVLLKKTLRNDDSPNDSAMQINIVPSGKTVFCITDIMIFLWLSAIAARSVHYFLHIDYARVISNSIFQLILLILWGIYAIAHILVGHKKANRNLWISGAVLIIADIVKLLLIDLAQSGAIPRIISFFAAGLLLLFIGWAAPLPAEKKEQP